MKFCLDISAIPYGTGVSRYTSNLARALSKEIPTNLCYFGSAFRQLSSIIKFNGYIYPFPPSITTKLFHQFNIPIDYIAPGIDVFHSWDWYLPKSQKTKIVITIHDLALFKYPDIAHPEIKAHHETVMARIKQFHPQIIAVSEATKNDLIELFDINPDEITVVYEALPDELKILTSKTTWQQVQQKYGIKKPYYLMVGTLEPRKNYLRQIQAWHENKESYDLIIVGKDGWEKIPNDPGIIRIKYATPEELAHLYAGAQLLLYCSLAEGFGLPILEALYHTCPVITSNCSSMKEIASGASLVKLVNPLSVEEIIAATREIFSKKDIMEDEFKDKEYFQKFSWEKAARDTILVYEKAMNS